MYYKRLFYRQFTNHFISGISNIHDLSIGADSNSERMIEHSDVRTTIFIALHSRKSDRGTYGSFVYLQSCINHSYTIVTTISDIQLTVFRKTDLVGIIKLGISQ